MMKKKLKQFGYPLLDTPRAPVHTRIHTHPGGWDAGHKSVHAQEYQREALLYKLFGTQRPQHIDLETRTLIRRMAAALEIPGFLLETDIKTGGRPTKWTSKRCIVFIKHMEEIFLAKGNISVLQAAQIAKVRHNYTEKPITLKKRYEAEIAKNGSVAQKIHNEIQRAKNIEDKRNILTNY